MPGAAQHLLTGPAQPHACRKSLTIPGSLLVRMLAQRRPARCGACLPLLADWPATLAEWLFPCYAWVPQLLLLLESCQPMLQPTGRGTPLGCWLLSSIRSRLSCWSLLQPVVLVAHVVILLICTMVLDTKQHVQACCPGPVYKCRQQQHASRLCIRHPCYAGQPCCQCARYTPRHAYCAVSAPCRGCF